MPRGTTAGCFGGPREQLRGTLTPALSQWEREWLFPSHREKPQGRAKRGYGAASTTAIVAACFIAGLVMNRNDLRSGLITRMRADRHSET